MFHNKLIALALLLAGCTLICAAQMDVSLGKAELPVTENPLVPPVEEVKTTTAASTTTTTTTSTTTTPETTTTTTPAPTPAPTTTTAAPSTTPAPAPYPEPSIGTWNSTCIMIKMAAQLNFTYETKDGNMSTALYNIPVDAKVFDSICDQNTTQSLQVNWGAPEAQYSMLLQFNLINKTSHLSMMKFVLPLIDEKFPDAKANQTLQLLHRGADFGAPIKMSYHCTRSQRFNLTETVTDLNIVGTVTVHDVQTEAFRVPSSGANFSNAKDCDSSETSDMVPIAVGIALAALIMIVLISYLCARRRSTSRGYMSF